MTYWKQGLGIAAVLAAVLAVTSGQTVIYWTAVALSAAYLLLRVVERVRVRRERTDQDSLSDRADE
jgi:uncharacterized membrane protein